MNNVFPDNRVSAPLERIAYHEAGHAVAGCVVGLHFSTLSIEPDQDSQGHCQFKGSVALDRFAELSYQASLRVSAAERQRARAVVEPHIIASLAGLLWMSDVMRGSSGDGSFQ